MKSEVNRDLRAHVDMLAAKSRAQGVPLAEVLNAAGLLFTEDHRRWQRAHALRQFHEDLEAHSVPQLVGTAYAEGRTTAKDMRRGITELLAARVELAKQGKA